MVKRTKRGQTAGPAAAFIAMIAGFILLYILLMPPDLRQELLEGDGTTMNTPNSQFSGNSGSNDYYDSSINKSVFEASPGRISYLKFDEFEHSLPVVNLYTTTNAQQTLIGDSLYVKNGVFDKEEKTLAFQLPDLEQVDNVYMSFNLNQNRNNKGRLVVWLNDNQIFERELGDKGLEQPIILTTKYLKEQNTLKFGVSSVRWKFWTTNDYELDDITVIYDYTDLSQQASKNMFMIDDAEKYNMEKAVLKFNPECTPGQVGVLNVKVNNNVVFSAIPDCGQLNLVEMSAYVLEGGQNYVNFETEKGYYLIDNIMVETKMKQMSYPTYYFDMDERIFNVYEEEEDEEECGDVDGVCPTDCPEYLDKDCCLQMTSKYWCDVKTDNINERCRSVVYENDCPYCPSGYEDSEGEPPEVCEGHCGDDTDNECVPGCSKLYDEDCCYEEAETNYWCDDVPKYGLSYVCRQGIHLEDCEDCQSGYETEEGTLECPDTVEDLDEKSVLKSGYDVWLKFTFLDDGDRKAARIFVNGYQFYMDTTGDSYKRKIDDYIEDGSNAIKIEPDVGSLDVIKMNIDIDKAS